MAAVIPRQGNELIQSYLALRRAVGFIAMALPFTLMLVQGGGLDSMSQAYFTVSGTLFVAGVCTIGVFLLLYRGFDRRDRVASLTAGVAALVVGLVPCGCKKSNRITDLWGWDPSYTDTIFPLVHLVAAALLFGVLAVFCLWLFPMSSKPKNTNPKKDQRNRIYYATGMTITGCLFALVWHFGVFQWVPPGGLFWLETVMLIAFGLSWAVKGEAISMLNDSHSQRTEPGSDRSETAREAA